MNSKHAGWTKRVIGSTLLLLTGCLTHPGDLRIEEGILSDLPLIPERRMLMAGAYRVDITPPPGYGMMGWGPEGKASRGHRQRLHARAVALQDENGERLVFIATELGEISVTLQRRIANVVARSKWRVGADRLILGATHTHSAPGNYFGNPGYDQLGSTVEGFDSLLVRFLTKRISGAIDSALSRMRPARVAWGTDTLWDVTRVRSLGSYRRNPPETRRLMQFPWELPPRLPPSLSGVDPTWWMLRIDTLTPGGDTRPLAALSVFAVHGTLIPPGNDLYDSDLHGYVSRQLERTVDPAGSVERPAFTHALLNSAQGDATPAYDGRTRCAPPTIVRVRSAGPNAAQGGIQWQADPDQEERNMACVPFAVQETMRIGDAIVARVARLHRDLGRTLSANVSLGRAFTSVSVSYEREGLLCPPRAGVAQVAGAPDGWARERHWPLLFLEMEGADSMVTAPRDSVGCQGAKRPFLGLAQSIVVGSRPLPRSIPLTIARVGTQWLVTVPAEPTTHSGWTIRRQVADSLGFAGMYPGNVAVIGLANGYNSYLTTPYEYAAQSYEGASTIFGPNTLKVVADTLAGLASRMFGNGGASVHPISMPDDTGWVTKYRNIGQLVSCDTSRPPSQPIDVRTEWSEDSLIIRWRDIAPGSVYACTNGPWFVIETESDAGAPRTLAVDGDIDVEVRVASKPSRGSWEYRARWTPRDTIRSVRVRFLDRGR
jgi:neutral ceramidase